MLEEDVVEGFHRRQLARLRAADPQFVASDAQVLAAALRGVFDRLRDGERALVFGHSPTNEAAVWGLAGVEVPPLAKGAGVLVVQEDGSSFRVAAVS